MVPCFFERRAMKNSVPASIATGVIGLVVGIGAAYLVMQFLAFDKSDRQPPVVSPENSLTGVPGKSGGAPGAPGGGGGMGGGGMGGGGMGGGPGGGAPGGGAPGGGSARGLATMVGK